MALIKSFDQWLINNMWFMAVSFTLSIGGTLVLFLLALKRTLDGNRNYFVIGICLTFITLSVLYALYVFLYFLKDINSNVLFFAIYTSFQLTYWLLAFRYFKSSIMVPYKFAFKKPPAKVKRRLVVMLWVGNVLVISTSGYILFESR